VDVLRASAEGVNQALSYVETAARLRRAALASVPSFLNENGKVDIVHRGGANDHAPEVRVRRLQALVRLRAISTCVESLRVFVAAISEPLGVPPSLKSL